MKSKPDPPVFRQPGRYSLQKELLLEQEFSTVKIPKRYRSDFCVFSLLLLYWIHKSEGDWSSVWHLRYQKNSWQNWIKKISCSSCLKAWSRKKNYVASWLFLRMSWNGQTSRCRWSLKNGTLRRQLALDVFWKNDIWYRSLPAVGTSHHVRGMFQWSRSMFFTANLANNPRFRL